MRCAGRQALGGATRPTGPLSATTELPRWRWPAGCPQVTNWAGRKLSRPTSSSTSPEDASVRRRGRTISIASPDGIPRARDIPLARPHDERFEQLSPALTSHDQPEYLLLQQSAKIIIRRSRAPRSIITIM